MRKALLLVASPLIVTCLLATVPALSADQTLPKNSTPPAAKLESGQNLVDKATNIVNEMRKDTNLKQLMEKAKGIFIVPRYAKGGLIIGAQGGQGILLRHRGSTWTMPVFYDTGGISFGLQGGVSAGSVVMLLMTDKAVDRFRSNDRFALNAEAGITAVKYSAAGRATPGQPDVILWSDGKGAYLGAALSVTDIHRNTEQNKAYYGQAVTEAAVNSGNLSNPGARKLTEVLPEG